jgi:hypothetical protein
MGLYKPKSIEKSCYIYKATWSSKNHFLPEQVGVSCGKKFIFNCLKCSHEYEQRPADKLQGKGCPYCANKLRCGCEHCLKNSCFRYKEEWSDKNKENCEYVAISSHKKYWFNCLNCSHEYEQSPDSKTNKGAGCPYCDNKLRCGYCERCLKNSCFIYKDDWSDKNKKNCQYVAISSRKKFIFNCNICSHEYEQSPNSKSNQGQGCPYCVNKTELKVANFLKQQNIKFESQFKIKNIKKYYGDQHFKQVSNWGCPIENVNNDIEKMKTGLENSISFLRIYQPDIWENKIEWKTIIKDNLYIRTLPDISYVSSNNSIYDNHQHLSDFL